jgi:CubicO group peptidase (beta-lactamase class C family)
MPAQFTRRDFLKLAGAASLAVLAPRNGQRYHAESLAMMAKQWTATGHTIAELADFDNTMQSFMQARSISGGALAVTRNGRLVLARGYTYTDDAEDLTVQPTSLFRIASISKPLTATAVLRLVQDGRLSLSSKVKDLISLTPPPGQFPDARLANVTVRNLLQHLGGWNRDIAFDPMFRDANIAAALGSPLPISQDNILTYMTGQPLQHNPGTIYAYSNYGYCLLGQIITAVTGLPYANYVSQVVFNPLLITRPTLGRTLPANRLPMEVKYHSQYFGPTVFNNSGSIAPYPYGGWNLENMDSHGGWLASAIDLVRFAASFDDPASSPLLNAASITTMFGLPENIPSANYTPGDWYYACGWAVRDWGGGNRNTWHDGSLDGTYTLMVRRGSDHTNWCVLFNQRDDASNLSYSDIDGALHAAANAVTTWPDHDLFSEYLSKFIYLPMVTK